jgi:acetylornithine deacetylase/succinyl-diaminopimelate desuccinylase-like protein
MKFSRLLLFIAVAAISTFTARVHAQWNASAIEAETMQHFQAMVRLDTTSPPGNEKRVVDYLEQVLKREGIAYQVFAKDPQRPNLVARIKGNGKKRPILVMGHTDVVLVDPQKWSVPPFGATRDGGYVYGRGTVDDKDSVVAGLMLMLTLKRQGTALDRDVIFLAEAGEEGAPEFGAQFMIDNHFSAIDAEYCFAEGGGVARAGGRVTQATVGTTEKEPRPIVLTAHGTSGHGSVPLKDNAIARLSAALGKISAWVPPLLLSETTIVYFKTLANSAPPDVAQRYRDVIGTNAKAAAVAAEWMLENQPQHWAMLHSSLVPTIIDGGYRYNVIPSEAKATVDVRLHPEEDQKTFLDRVRAVINDPNVDVRWSRDSYRPAGASRLNTEAFTVLQNQLKAHYNTVTLPMMGTGATDMSQIRSKGVQCYGIGPAVDTEDSARGFGAHSDQERILESELHRFVRFQYDVVMELARAR